MRDNINLKRMDTVKIFSVDFFEKKRAFSCDKLLNGIIFAERERERERERLVADTSCIAFLCAYTLNYIATTLIIHNVVAFLFPVRITVCKRNLYKF